MSENVKKMIFRADAGIARINWRTMMVKFDFDIRSEESLGMLMYLEREERRFLFDNEFVKLIVDKLWERSAMYHWVILLLFSAVMICLSVDISVEGIKQL